MKFGRIFASILIAAALSSGAWAQSQLDPVTVPVGIDGDFLTEGNLCGDPTCNPARV